MPGKKYRAFQGVHQEEFLAANFDPLFGIGKTPIFLFVLTENIYCNENGAFRCLLSSSRVVPCNIHKQKEGFKI